MAQIPRPNDDEKKRPLDDDDQAELGVTDGQAAIRNKRHTDRQMAKVAEAIYGSLAEYASHMSYVREQRRIR